MNNLKLPEGYALNRDKREGWYWLDTPTRECHICIDRHLSKWYISDGKPSWAYQLIYTLFETVEDAANFAVALHITGAMK